MKKIIIAELIILSILALTTILLMLFAPKSIAATFMCISVLFAIGGMIYNHKRM